MVRLLPGVRKNEQDFGNLLVSAPGGQKIPLAQLAEGHPRSMEATAPGERVALSRRQCVLSVLIFSVILLSYLDRQTLSVLAPVIRRDLGLSPVEYAWAVNAFLLAYGIMYAGSGMLLDRWGFRAGMAVSVCVWSAVCGQHAATFGLASLGGFPIPAGDGGTGRLHRLREAITTEFGTAQRGIAAGMLSAGGSLGAVVSPPLIIAI